MQSTLPEGEIPFPVVRPDRIPVERYFDQEFYELENERLWPYVWQMACRLEEIPQVGNYVVYRNLGKSIIVIRTSETQVKAFHNHCRHRGVELVQATGLARGGFICPFHGWRWDKDGNNTFVFQPDAFSEGNMCDADLNLVPVRVDTWGGCAFINLDDDAAPLRDSLEPFATQMDAWKVEDLRVEWWRSTVLPVNWKLAMEAFMEGYHVATTHPQLLPPGATSRPGEALWLKVPEEHVTATYWLTVAAGQMPTEVDSQMFIDLNLAFMQILSEGMAGMTHEQEIAVAKKLKDIDLPKNPLEAAKVWRRLVNQVVMDYYDEIGTPCGDLNEIDSMGYGLSVNFCFPHYFILPTFGSASSYRIRPLGPESCLFELWSLTRYPKGQEPESPQRATELAYDDPSWPEIPKQDYSNLPRQQRGLHSGMSYMRLSNQMEGMISNNHRLIDGYLRRKDKAKLAAAAQKVSGPIDVPIAELGLDAE